MSGQISGRFLLPHPPAAVAEVGGDSLDKIRKTIAGFETVSQKIAALKPETVIVITPHGPCFSDHFYIHGQKRISGDFSAFGAKKPILAFDNDLPLIASIAERAEARGLSAGPVDDRVMKQYGLDYDLDHGVTVPLYFIAKACTDFSFNVVAVSLSGCGGKEHYLFGIALREAILESGRNAVIVAGGDLSHKLREDGPYGFCEEGPAFDDTVKQALLNEDVFGLLSIDPLFKEKAAQCGLDSYRVLLGTLDGFRFLTEIFSYEGPLGVGYLTASLKESKAAESLWTHYNEKERALLEERQKRESAPVRFARRVLDAYLNDGVRIEADAEEMREINDIPCFGLFVSVKIDGNLRGCIGTVRPIRGYLCEEIADFAIEAATKDPRFPPLSGDELRRAAIGIDLLDRPESCEEKDLDPQKYGVIVESKGKTGLLLPNVEGIDRVEDQIAVAKDKAHIHPLRNVNLKRFTVTRYL